MNYFEAKLRLNKFLEEHPELKEKQKEIEKELNKANSKQNRLAIMQSLFYEQVEKFKNI